MKEDEAKLLEEVKNIISEVVRVLSAKLLAAIEVIKVFTPLSFTVSWLAVNKYQVTFKVSDTDGAVPVDRLITIEFNDNTLDNSLMIPIDKLANINTLDQHQTAILRVAYILFLAVKEARHPELGPDYANVVLEHSKDAKVIEIKNMYDSPSTDYPESEATKTDSSKAAEDVTDSIIASAVSGTATVDPSKLSSATEMTEAVERAM